MQKIKRITGTQLKIKCVCGFVACLLAQPVIRTRLMKAKEGGEKMIQAAVSCRGVYSLFKRMKKVLANF